MSKLLVLTETLPRDFERETQGIVQRLRLFLDALASRYSGLRILFFARPATENTKLATEWAQDCIQRYWGHRAEVIIASPDDSAEAARASRWNHYVLPAVSCRLNRIAGRASSAHQLAVLRAELAMAPSAVLAHRLPAMYAFSLAMPRSRLPVFFDLDDVEHIRFLRTISTLPQGWRRLALSAQGLAVHVAERRAAAAASMTFVCSEHDRQYLSERLRLPRITVIPNAVGLPTEVPPLPRSRIALFVGALRYEPNLLAARWLIRDIWPLVRARVPDARLLVAGDGAELLEPALAGMEGVAVLGYVRSLESVYRDAEVACCPIRTGSGTRIKLIEAAAMGRPIVSTTIGAEGLGMVNDVHALIRDDAPGLADAVADLMLDRALGERIAAEARRLVEAKNARESVIASVRSATGGQGTERIMHVA